LTTKEILEQVGQVEELVIENRARLRKFLEGTDLVKFADHRPAEEEIKGHYEEAMQFIQQTAILEADEAERSAA